MLRTFWLVENLMWLKYTGINDIIESYKRSDYQFHFSLGLYSNISEVVWLRFVAYVFVLVYLLIEYRRTENWNLFVE